MAAVTICSDFGAPKIKSATVSTVASSICHEVMGPDATILALISHTSKVRLKVLQARLQQYVNCELPDVQAGFRKGRGTRDQIANICWISKKQESSGKNIYFCFIDYAKAFDCVDHNNLWKIFPRVGNTRPPDLPLEKSGCRSGSNS